jgi:hypothetical protein
VPDLLTANANKIEHLKHKKEYEFEMPPPSIPFRHPCRSVVIRAGGSYVLVGSQESSRESLFSLKYDSSVSMAWGCFFQNHPKPC